MARSAEIQESVDAPVERPQQSLLGDSLVNQSDSDIARNAAQGTQDDAIAMLDPSGNEFRIDGLNEGQEQNFLNMQAQNFSKPQAGDKPGGVDRPAGTDRPPNAEPPADAAQQSDRRITLESGVAFNSDDGLTKSVSTKEGSSTIQFSPDGKLQSFTTRNNDGSSSMIQFGNDGRATSHTITNAQGETTNITNPAATRVDAHLDEIGDRIVSISEPGRTSQFRLDNDGNIRQAAITQGFNYDSKSFDEKGNVDSVYTRRTSDGIMTATYTQRGYQEQTVVNKDTDQTTITRVNQLNPHTKSFDTAGQRTDVINMHADGSSEARTTFRNEPGITYQTRTGSDGRYQTDRVNDATGESVPYQHGNQSRRG